MAYLRNTLTLIFIFFVCIAFSQTSKTYVLFDKGSYELTKSSLSKLELIAKDVLSKDKAYKLVLTGHTDSDGSITYNQELSANRMKAVLNHLVSKGLNSKKISSDYFGELQPIAKNTSEVLMAKNRRVEIAIVFSPKPPEITIPKDTIVEVDKCDGDTIIYLPKGTSLKLSVCDFEKYKNQILSSYEITTKEEILNNDVGLTTNLGQNLITGGMIKLADEDVQFERPVEVRMPLIQGFSTCNDSDVLSRMRLYTANHNGQWVDSDTVNYNPEEQVFTFTVMRGGMINCDAIGRASQSPLNALTGGLNERIARNRLSYTFKAPSRQRIRSIQLATGCTACGELRITERKSVRYNKRRTKAKILLDCCPTDSLIVSVRYSNTKGKKLTYLKDLKKKGPWKLAACGSSAGILAGIRRIFSDTPKVFRKYKLKA
jgi:hypothetical protein